MKVLITDKINESAGKIIGDAAQCDFLPTMSEDELCKVIGEYDALMVRSQTKVTAKILEAGKNLKIVGRAGVGVDNVDLNAATQNGIIVVNSPDGNTTAAAEHTLAMMLAMTRNIAKASEVTKTGVWDRAKFTGTEVFGKTLGIIGFGKIGAHVGKVALALGMNVIVYDPYATQEIVEKAGAKYIKTLDEFWGECDFITLHVPKTKETMNLINKDTLSRMKKGVKIVNCARGGIIDEAALKEAIDNGQVGGCAIDVYEAEPNIQECPLLDTGMNVVLTPHLGASTKEAQLNVAIDVAEQIREVLLGGSARSAVNIPSLKPAKLEPVKDYMLLAENIGEIVQQLSKNAISNLDICVQGSLAELDVSPLETAILKGFFAPTTEGVNYVNANIIAQNRGLDVTVTKDKAKCAYAGLITVKASNSEESNTVSGALIAQDVRRIVRINKYNTLIKPEEHMLLVPHENKPSMVAKVATVLGENNININNMQVAQKSGNEKDAVSIMLLSIDKEADDKLVEQINNIDGITDAKSINLQ